MDLRQLSYFVTIVEEGTITGAARKLHISQPPLSHQMHLLEKELDAVLFIRGARQIKLTEPGIALYRYAMEMLELEQVAKDEITSLTSGARGSIRLGLVSSSASPGLYRSLARFHKTFPDVSLKVYEGNTFELLDMLEKGKIEVAILRTPFSGDGLDISPIQHDHMVAAGTSEFFNTESSLTVRDLTHYPLILYRRWSKTILNTFNREMLTPSIFCIADDARTCLQLAQVGMGVALVPCSIVSWGHGLTIRQLDELSWESRLVVVKRKSAPVSHKVEVFYNLLAKNKDR
ncbi:LysR family transcriptional regulator [Allisonella histaminiformans]|uniref:LysR family transcriptional regulator n=1 Tax=Allisonella histaminiformans TaxID=209880 RepID=UPI0026704BCE|nr:LysR family transcriptional regulator [uncultured Allisonella sp.]